MSAPPPEVASSVDAATNELGELGIEVEVRSLLPPQCTSLRDPASYYIMICPPDQTSHCSGRVWSAAIVLKQFLESEKCKRLRSDDAVLELGAGTGWLALKMSRRFHQWTATETEDAGAFERLRRNVARGGGRSSDAGTRPMARALDWNDVDGFMPETMPDGESRPWDFVCGSDLVYSAAGANALAKCLAVILSGMRPRGQESQRTCIDEEQFDCRPIAIAQTCGRWGGHGHDEALYRALGREGLGATPVWGELLADSDEMRQHVIVFRIDWANDEPSFDKDWASHPLLRAARLHAIAEKAAFAALTEEERGELEASRLFGEL